jgi:hypothetical protein
MAGLVKRMATAVRATGELPTTVVDCMCGWKSAAHTSRTSAVAQHKSHVSDECPIGRRQPLPESFKRSTG